MHLLLAFGAFLLATSGGAAARVHVLAAGGAESTATTVAVAAAAMVVAWMGVCVALVEITTRHHIPQRALQAVFLGGWVLLTVGAAAWQPTSEIPEGGTSRAALAAGPLAVGASIALLMRPRRAVYAALGVGLTVVFAVTAWGPPHLGVRAGVGAAVLTAGICVFVVPTAPLTAWMIDVVRRLAAARQVAADLAVAEERLRFSRDLHDVFGRTLSTVAIKSELAAELARRGDERAAAEMDAVRDLAQGALAEVRGVVRGYRRIDLAEEVSGARSVLRSAGIPTHVTGFDDDSLAEVRAAVGDAAAEALAWVVREGVTNVLRHGAATGVDLRLVRDVDSVVLTVANTSAHTAPRPRGAGSGLHGLRERLDAVGGTIVAAPLADAPGYELRAVVPTGA